MKESDYWANITENDIRRELAVGWWPEIEAREMFWGSLPTPKIITLKKKDDHDGVGESRKDGNKDSGMLKGKLLNASTTASTSVEELKHHQLLVGNRALKGKVEAKVEVSSYSLFDRFQSLLVEVGSDDDDEEDDDIGSDDEYDIQELAGTMGGSYDDDDEVLDVSELSLDQRTYLHLRDIHLIDQPLLPSSHPTVVEEDRAPPSTRYSSTTTTLNKRSRIVYTDGDDENGKLEPNEPNIKSTTTTTDDDDDMNMDMDILIRRRQIELSELHRHNNETTAFIQDKARQFISSNNKANSQAILDKQNNLIHKHGQVAKRQRRVNNRKVEKRTDEWMPW